MSKEYPLLDDKSWLYHKYHTEESSLTEIAKEVGCCIQTIANALNRHNISQRPLSEVFKLRKFPNGTLKPKYPLLHDEIWLYQKYWIEELSTCEIANDIGCCFSVVSYALKRYNIPRRKQTETKQSEKIRGKYKYKKLGDKQWLYQKYWIEKLSRPKIANIIGCSQSAVQSAFGRLGMSCRSLSEANTGGHHSEETKRKLSASHKNPSEETRRKIREARKKQILPKHHTKIENIYEEISKKNNIPSEYTGDSKIWIGRVNPDFIIRDKKIAIFINGDYWHSGLLRYNIRYTQQPKNQIKECKRHKWKAVIIWGTDLEREDAEAHVLYTLRKEGIIK